MDHYKEILGGSAAGIMQILVGYPFDTVKVRYIETNSKSISSCLKTMIKDNGIKSFYQGVKSPLYGSIFYNTNMFYSYSLFDRYISDKKNSIFHNSFICGSLVGITTTIVECPIDLIKTQMQCNKNMIIKDIGIKNVYRGFTPTILRNIPSTGFYFGIYTHLKIKLPIFW